MRDHEVFAAGGAYPKPQEKIGRREALMVLVAIGRIEETSLHPRAGFGNPVIKPMIEWAGRDIQAMQLSQRIRRDLGNSSRGEIRG